MKPGRKLVLEAVLGPLVFWVIMWGLFYIHPTPDLRRENFNAPWLMTSVASFFVALTIALFMLKRRLEKEHNSKFGFRELPRVIDETDPEVIRDLTKDISFIILMWGPFASAVLDMGVERGVVYFLDFAVQCVMVCVPLFLAIGVLFIDFPIFLYARFIGKDSSPGSREILLGSLISLVSLVAVGVATSFNVRVEATLPILNLPSEDPVEYRYVLLLSGLNVLYSLLGMLVYPKKRKLGLLLSLPIVPLIAYTLLKTLVWMQSH
ncbi:Hypothetical protein TON_1880 [Thermococcus onnurineus NA1]|uniref:Uncharacterized protein n=1 Tax=Thermococcus onnurineus (strain NA1) TaxID=523850 RepID=B6YVP7_THEON|nr:hypothetical protein [Thermococcus onnurineus]ACJ17371.1 Hypothetical protein TON_1880 [Thermococcus onnurineus NA1]